MKEKSITIEMDLCWRVGEAVRIWSMAEQKEIEGIVHDVTDTDLSIRIIRNQKIYTYNLDGTARLPGRVTGRRVYSLRERNYEAVSIPTQSDS